jgi:hypothetical protein
MYKTHHVPASSITPHRLNNFSCQDFNHYPFLTYICTTCIILTEIIIIFNCYGEMVKQLTTFLTYTCTTCVILTEIIITFNCYGEMVTQLTTFLTSAFSATFEDIRRTQKFVDSCNYSTRNK